MEGVLERKLSRLSGYVPARNNQKERRSDRFAQSVLLQQEVAAICSLLGSNGTDFLARRFGVPSRMLDICWKEVCDSRRAMTESYSKHVRSHAGIFAASPGSIGTATTKLLRTMCSLLHLLHVRRQFLLEGFVGFDSGV